MGFTVDSSVIIGLRSKFSILVATISIQEDETFLKTCNYVKNINSRTRPICHFNLLSKNFKLHLYVNLNCGKLTFRLVICSLKCINFASAIYSSEVERLRNESADPAVVTN